MERREMLSEYFSLDIGASGQVESLPLLLRDYTPQLDNLPDFLMRLGPQVSTVRSVLAFTDIRHDPRWTGGPKLDVLIPSSVNFLSSTVPGRLFPGMAMLNGNAHGWRKGGRFNMSCSLPLGDIFTRRSHFLIRTSSRSQACQISTRYSRGVESDFQL